MSKKILEDAKDFIDENNEAKGVLLVLTFENGNIRYIDLMMSPFEKIGIGEWIRNEAFRSIRPKPIDDEEDEDSKFGGYVS